MEWGGRQGRRKLLVRRFPTIILSGGDRYDSLGSLVDGRTLVTGVPWRNACELSDLRRADPLLYTGHVGLSFDHGATIYGFSAYVPGEHPRQVIDRLKRGGTYPGIVQDDRAVFERAAAAANRGLLASPVYLWAQAYDTAILANIRARFENEPIGSAHPEKRYGWLAGQEGVYNCATWPRNLGVVLPEESGQLADFIAALRLAAGGQRWAP